MLNLNKVTQFHLVNIDTLYEDEKVVVLKLVSGETLIGFVKQLDYAFEIFRPVVYEIISSRRPSGNPEVFFSPYIPGVNENTQLIIRRHVMHVFEEEQIEPFLVSAYLRWIENVPHEGTIH